MDTQDRDFWVRELVMVDSNGPPKEEEEEDLERRDRNEVGGEDAQSSCSDSGFGSSISTTTRTTISPVPVFNEAFGSSGFGTPPPQEQQQQQQQQQQQHVLKNDTLVQQGGDNNNINNNTGKRRRKPIPRKGHTKSRRGCLSCKKRKVKCQENRPECDNCVRIGLVCEYPTSVRDKEIDGQRGTELGRGKGGELAVVRMDSQIQQGKMLSSSPTVFTRDDMRFFHHFLVTAYPPLPFQGQGIWRDVAALSHEVCLLLMWGWIDEERGIDEACELINGYDTNDEIINVLMTTVCEIVRLPDARHAGSRSLASRLVRRELLFARSIASRYGYTVT